jgi:NADH-quinone oxidoreductase subunit H
MNDFLQNLFGSWMPGWLAALIAHLITIVVVLVAAVVTMMLQVWLERRVVARMQDRIGPNRVGPAGLLQSVADGVKMFTKEDIVPRAADRWVHLLAPVVATAPVMAIFAVIPWARGVAPSAFGSGVLFALAISSVSAIGLMMAGWSSSNKFALLGAMRAVAQLISYEIPGVLAVLAVVLYSGTMVVARLPEMQSGVPLFGDLFGLDLGLGWNVFTPVGLLGFAIFFICMLAEGERTPFDIPEADSEIVAGHTTEYSGMKFALFYVGQYILNFVLAMLAANIFLGGWQGPGVSALAAIGGTGGAIAAGLLSLLWLLLKAWGLFFVMIWLRGAFPRLRVDQLMGFAWKFLLPLALINILSAALWVAIQRWGTSELWTLTISVPFVGVSALGWLEQATPLVRQVVALIVTGVLNAVVLRWLLHASAPIDGRAEAVATPLAVAAIDS